MKDGIVLHPEHGLNPSIELCIVCGEEMGIALLGNNIKGQAPHHICTGGVCDNCKKIIRRLFYYRSRGWIRSKESVSYREILCDKERSSKENTWTGT